MCEKVLVKRAALKSIINGKEYTGLQPFTVKCTPPSVTNSFMNMNQELNIIPFPFLEMIFQAIPSILPFMSHEDALVLHSLTALVKENTENEVV